MGEKQENCDWPRPCAFRLPGCYGREVWSDAPVVLTRSLLKLNCPPQRIPASSAPAMQQVNLGMVGGGTVGSGVFHALQLNGELMASRIGARVNLRKIAVKAFDEPRPY